MCALRIRWPSDAMNRVGLRMPTVDEILASSPLAALRRVSRSGGDRHVTMVRLGERFADLSHAPATSFVVLSRAASAEVTDYRLDRALRWASVHKVAAVAAFTADHWRPTVTVTDIAGRADIALISIPPETDLTELVQAINREIGGDAERVLGRAQQGLDAVLAAEEADADLSTLCASVARALGTPVEFRPVVLADGSSPNGETGYPAGAMRGRDVGEAAGPDADEVAVPVVVGETPIGYLAAPHAHGDASIGARLVLHTAALAAARLLDLARRARELPVRSRSELLAELLMSEDAINEDLLDRARQLGIPVGGWHVAVRIEADDLEEAEPDEIHRFELLEAAGQIAMQAVAAAGGNWYLSRIARAIVLIRVTG